MSPPIMIALRSSPILYEDVMDYYRKTNVYLIDYRWLSTPYPLYEPLKHPLETMPVSTRQQLRHVQFNW